MNINTIREDFDFLSNKYQSGSVSGTEFSALFNYCQRDYWNFLVGPIEQFQPGRPVSRIAVGMGQHVMGKIAPFITPETISVNPTTGAAAKPADHAYLFSMRTAAGLTVRRKNQDQIYAANSSTIIPVATNPFFVEYASAWTVYPFSVGTVTIDYLRLPADVKWNFDVVAGREVYKEQGSVHPEWKDADINHIVVRMLKEVGVHLKDQELMQIGELAKNTGE